MMHDVNLLTVFVAALSAFFIGGLWYSPLIFGKIWIRESGYDEEQSGHPARVFGMSFIFSLIAAYGFGQLVGDAVTPRQAVHYALLVGVGFVLTSFGINYQFATRSLKLLLIDSGYHILQFLLYAMVFAYWP